MGSRSKRKSKNGDTRYSNGWHKVLIRKMLRQKKYIGDWRYGESIHVKLDGKRITRPADPKDVIQVHRPDLVIVPLHLWDKVQARLAYFQKRGEYKEGQKKRGPKRHYMDDYPIDLVGGNLYCAECGARLHLVPNSNQGPYYRCPIALSNGKHKGVAACKQLGFVHKTRAIEALCSFIREHMLGCEEWLDAVYDGAKDEFQRRLTAAPSELKSLQDRHKALVAAIANITKAIESGVNVALESLVKRLAELEAEKAEAEIGIQRSKIAADTIASLPTKNWVQSQLIDLAGTLMDDQIKAAKLFREFFGKINVRIVVAPGKKRGHPVLEFQPNTGRLLSRVMCMPLVGTGGLDIQPPQPQEPTVTIPLAGCDKLDKLMPTIDAMRKAGKRWVDISSELKISKSWANRYYNQWKQLTQENSA